MKTRGLYPCSCGQLGQTLAGQEGTLGDYDKPRVFINFDIDVHLIKRSLPYYAELVRLGCLSTKLTTDGRLGFSKDPDKHSTIRWTHCVQTSIEHSFFISYWIIPHLVGPSRLSEYCAPSLDTDVTIVWS